MASSTSIGDLPDVILYNIFYLVTDPRTRNSLSLVSRKFLALERATRASLTLRGNARDLFMIPNSFRSVSSLDLSFLSPWGHPLLVSSPPDHQPFLARLLQTHFPAVESLVVYSRSSASLDLLLPHWPKLRHIKLVRWHPRPAGIPLGSDFLPIFEHCGSLESLDLSTFYHWTEDLPAVLRAYPDGFAKLTRLDLMTASLIEGYESREIAEITKSCPNLRDFRVACTFDPRYSGFVGDETLSAVATNCPKLTLLHMVDRASLSNPRAGPGNESNEDARITPATVVEVFSTLPNLEELVLDVGKNVKQSGVAFEAMNTKCKKLRVLKLGQFQDLCSAVDWRRLDGVALCGGLRSLSIKNSCDLSDMGLVAIGKGCCKLTKFEVQGCENITVKGLRTLTSLLKKTLTDVKIACCKNLDASASLRAMEPIRDRIRRLHIDCVWSGLEEEGGNGSDLIEAGEEEEEEEGDEAAREANGEIGERSQKRCKYAWQHYYLYPGSNGKNEIWEKLEYLSLWISVGDNLAPLRMAGLDDCPNLEEIKIKIEGDCRGRHKPAEPDFGLSCLVEYPKLSKMQLDCGDTIGYALTAPPLQMDLSLWERFFLSGIGSLNLSELDYWPPQDRDVNQRSLSLPAVGLLQECVTLRKLFIHGTAHEHFMMFFPRIPNLRDVQLREDYYPAPENDMSTEMRVASCCRFEDALNNRYIDD